MKTRSILTATFALLLTASTFAVSFTWDGGALLGPEWSRDNNWSGNNAPPSDGTADLFFAGSSRLDATADAVWNIRSLTFNSGAGVFDVQGSTLTIGSGGVTSNSANFQKVNNNIVLSAAQTFNTTSTGSLGLFGSVNLNGHALSIDPSMDTLSQVITFLGAISGAGGITKNGIGTMRLDNFTPNTFTGGITVNAGTLELTATDGTGSSLVSVPGPLEIVNGVVEVQSSSQIANSAAVIVRSSGSFVMGGVSSRAIDTIGVLTVDGGLVSIRPDCVLTASGLVMAGGQISGAVQSEFSLLGGGAVTVGSSAIAEISVTAMGLGGGVNTFNIANGTAAIDLRITAVISNGSITKTGAGLLQLAGVTANTYTGLTTVAAGTLELNKLAGVSAVAGSLTIGNGAPGGIVKLLDSDQISAASVVTIDAGTLDLNNFNQTLAQPLTMNGGSIVTGAGALTLNHNVTANASGSNLPTISGILNLGGTARTFTVNDSLFTNDLTIGAAISNGAFTKAGTGTLVLNGASANTYSGTTTVNAGELQLGKTAGVIAIAGALVVGDGIGAENVRLLANEQIANASALTINPASALRLDGFSETIGALTLNAGGVFDSAATGLLTLGGDLTVGGTGTSQVLARVSLGGATRIFNVANASVSGTDVLMNAVISNGAINKTGVGTAVLGGASTFAGGLVVNAGEVAFGNNAAAGTGPLTLNNTAAIRAETAARTLANAVTVGGNFTVGGTLALTLSGPMTITGNRTVTISNTALTTFSGAISQDIAGRALTKTGTGELTLSGPLAISTLNVNAGELNLATSATNAALNANAGTTNISANQTLASLTIGAGAIVTLAPASSPAVAGDVGEFAWDEAQFANTDSTGVVPEPGIGALLASALALLGARRGRIRVARSSRALVSASRRNELSGAPDSGNVCAFRAVPKVREGGTPSPTRLAHGPATTCPVRRRLGETRALPGTHCAAPSR